ncbi:MAG: hypothetical protein V5A87_01510 [Candidatus Bipolaricaulota bacterium]|nr:hypothetical protein [Candidatus Bipolaricaulota bacterium]MBS3791618.1 hypothetical protein [Candidatus Bipolaricaulota bacterium]
MKKDIRGILTIGRPVDPDYPSNAFIMLFSLAVSIGFGVYSYLTGSSALSSLLFGIRSFISVFLAWALGREVDPDRPLSAGLAAIGQVIVIWMVGVPSLLLPLWALLSFRILNRTTGIKAGWADSFLVTAFSLWLGYQFSWVVPGATAVILLSDGLMKDPNRKQIVPGLLTGGATVYLLINSPSIWTGYGDYPVKLGIVLGISLIFLSVIYDSRKVISTGDESGKKIYAHRVQLTQFIALSVAILFPLGSGVYGFHQFAVFWPVLGGSTLVHAAGLLLDTVS